MMNIKTIKELYDKNTPVMQSTQFILEALELFDSSKSSAIVIIDDKKSPMGILTERDIAKYAGHWDEILSLPVCEVMSGPVTTIGQEHDFRDAYMQMSENGFRHLVVVKEDGSLAGILDEGHFLRHLTPEQLLAVKEVKLVMSKSITTVESTQSVAETIQLMTESKISSVIIVRDKKPLGILTERDTVHLARQGDALLKAPITEHMTSPLKTIHEESSVIDAEHILTHQHIRHLVVVNDKEELRGIIAQHDLVKGISGIYVEMLRDTIRKQSDILHDTFNQLEDHAVLNNILNSFSERLIIACDLKSVVEFTNDVVFHNRYTLPSKGQKLDDNVQYFDSSISNSILSGAVTSIIYSEPRIYDSKGNKHYFKTSYTPIFSKKKLLQGFLFTAEDITSEKQSLIKLQETTEKLKESEKQFKAIFDNALDGILVADTITQKFYLGNQAICDMLGFTLDELKNITVADIHPEEALPYVLEKFKKLTEGEETVVRDIPILKKDASVFYADITAQAVMLDNQPMLLGIFHDITETKETKKILKEQNLLLQEREQQLLQAQAISKIGNWSLEIVTMQFYWSEEIRKIIGIAADVDVSLEYLSTIVVSADWPVVESSLMGAIKDGKPHNIDYRIMRPFDHEIRWVNCRGVRILDENQKPIKLVGTVQDITEKKEKEIKLVQQEEMMMIQSRQAAMGEMINMIAHQWRQPLSVVTMIMNNLLLDIELGMFDEVGAKENFVEINDQIQYMSTTIDDFRNFFKSSKELEKDSVLNILQDIMKIIGPALNSNNIQIEIECDAKLMLQTYKSELKQVIINILSNAKDALKNIQIENKIIQISVKEENEHIIFSIFNNGPKIDSNLLQRIFEPYFTTKEVLGGTGIGLYMSKSIIEKHMYGKIEVKNTKRGVEFTIKVPEVLEGVVVKSGSNL